MKAAHAIVAILLAANARATTHVACVADADGLVAALANLSTSTASTDADEIRLRAGTYLAPAAGFAGAVSDQHNLTIRGGYLDAACTLQSADASLTVLDGNHASSVLRIDAIAIPRSDIEVSGLTIQNGSTSAFQGCAGLKVGDPGPISGGNTLIERNIFRGNVATAAFPGAAATGALLAATDGASLIVRGNLFVANSAPNTAAAFFYSNFAIDVSNNTFALNEATDTTQKPRFLVDFFTATGLALSNNVFWGNVNGSDAFDVNLSGQFKAATLVDNDIQTPGGTAKSETGSVQVDPLFASPDDFHLAFGSPLIDAGSHDAAGGLTTFDLDGAPRIDASGVDLGAFESNYVFANGFD